MKPLIGVTTKKWADGITKFTEPHVTHRVSEAVQKGQPAAWQKFCDASRLILPAAPSGG